MSHYTALFDDRHVLAAAIVGRYDVIVTQNLHDFPPDTLKRYESKLSMRMIAWSAISIWL